MKNIWILCEHSASWHQLSIDSSRIHSGNTWKIWCSRQPTLSRLCRYKKETVQCWTKKANTEKLPQRFSSWFTMEVPAGPLVTEPNPKFSSGQWINIVMRKCRNKRQKTKWLTFLQVRNANPSISAICLRSVRISCCKKLSWSFGSIKCQQPRAIKAQGKGSKTSLSKNGRGKAKTDLQDYPLPVISWRFWNILKHPQNMIHVSSLDIQKRCSASGSHVEHMLIERWVQTKLCNYAEKIMESGFQPYPSNPKSLKSWLDNQSIMFRPPS